MRSLRAILVGFIQLVIVVGVMAQADFTADEVIGCTPLRVKFSLDTTTVDTDTISAITWYFGFGNTIDAIDPDTVVYPSGGDYTVIMTINGYSSSAVIKTGYITVYETVQADFIYEELAPQTYRFIPQDPIADPIARYFFMWRYDKTDGSDSQFTDYSNISNLDQDIAIDTVTLETGTYDVLLRIEDTYGCLSRYETQITVTGNIVQGSFTADDTTGCSPLSVRFSIDESTIDLDTVSYITWNFGVGDTVNTSSPDTGMTVVYPNGGNYTVTMAVNGYRSSAVTKEDYITVHQTVRAVFSSDEFAPKTFRFIPIDVIRDTSARYSYMWRYNKTDGSDSRSTNYSNISYLNQDTAIDTMSLDTGTYSVVLRIEDTYGCLSRFETIITVLEEIQIPNVFVAQPGNFFIINPQNISTILNFKVFNRYGTLVFEQEAPVINWDGRSTWGKDLVTGVYYYILQATQGDASERFSQKGFIHLYQKN
jgi:PKD repeat protein